MSAAAAAAAVSSILTDAVPQSLPQKRSDGTRATGDADWWPRSAVFIVNAELFVLGLFRLALANIIHFLSEECFMFTCIRSVHALQLINRFHLRTF